MGRSTQSVVATRIAAVIRITSSTTKSRNTAEGVERAVVPADPAPETGADRPANAPGREDRTAPPPPSAPVTVPKEAVREPAGAVGTAAVAGWIKAAVGP